MEECDFEGLRFLRNHPDSTVDAARHIGDLFKEAMREHYAHGGESLVEAMKMAGISDVKMDVQNQYSTTEHSKESIFNIYVLKTVKMVVQSVSVMFDFSIAPDPVPVLPSSTDGLLTAFSSPEGGSVGGSLVQEIQEYGIGSRLFALLD
ncbi:hypothetical protein DM02DRAFT_729273 [Periconia macrospinosa]|uniref:Uncharacterized protein n=1 Tax=Periconia macrospinosa TaxID=97972 RepID=A0A2V1DNA9_9PLEO|nr:hypothetical protein DM02DRAFT_729273 [Periconia macrospinosa]